MSNDTPFPTHRHVLADGRRLAFTDTGPSHARDVLVCLPGVLETRQTFAPVLHARPTGLRCLSLDYCGRGDSDPLPGDQGYSMARYCDDLLHFLGRHLQAHARLHLLGTSMGGILAFYLMSSRAFGVQTLLLNDIGLSLHWMSLLGMYQDMKKEAGSLEPWALAKRLQVTPGVLASVQLPTHFDLPYRKGIRGMHFAHLLDGYGGAVRLVRGQSSRICTALQVNELRQLHLPFEVMEKPGVTHPVPFDPQVCEFLLQGLTETSAEAERHGGSRERTKGARSTAAASPLWRWLQDRWHGR
jgi:pimeloyl-ACP methyl ester carboxylesterase